MRVSLKDFLDTYLGSRLGVDRSEVATNNLEGGYNIYGRIITKRKRGLLSFTLYLIHTLRETDGLIVALS